LLVTPSLIGANNRASDKRNRFFCPDKSDISFTVSIYWILLSEGRARLKKDGVEVTNLHFSKQSASGYRIYLHHGDSKNIKKTFVLA